METNSAVGIAAVPVIKLTATPAKEICASVSAIVEYRLTTKNNPIVGATIATIIPTINARCMKSNKNNSIINFMYRDDDVNPHYPDETNRVKIPFRSHTPFFRDRPIDVLSKWLNVPLLKQYGHHVRQTK